MSNQISLPNLSPNAGQNMENAQGSRYNYGPRKTSATEPDVYVGAETELDKNSHDVILSNSPSSKYYRVKMEQITNIPSYIVRGLKGDPDSNFYEYLQITKVPYFIGGPVLAGMFAAGINSTNLTSKAAASLKAKQVALGVALYYLGSALAKTVINGPVKWFRGIDLEHPYRRVVDLREGNAYNLPTNKKKEMHKVFESVDFTRWDLLYDETAPNAKGINARFDKIKEKFGIKADVVDSDSTLKEKIKQTIVMSRAWKYLLTVPFVMLGLGLAKQPSLMELKPGAIFSTIKKVFKNKDTSKFAAIKESAQFHVWKPITRSFAELWKGTTRNSKILGRFAILGSVVGPIIANACILTKSYAGSQNYVNLAETKDNNKGQM